MGFLMNQKIIVLQGLPASGKSSWAKKFTEENENYVRVCRDDLRRMRGKYWIPEQEDMITKWEVYCVETAIEHGKSVIIDATNLNRNTIGKWNTIAEEFHTQIEYKFFDVGLTECIERDKYRENSVGEKVIKKMYRQYEHYFKSYKLNQDENLQPCIIVDIDGTLAERVDRGPFDWGKVDSDIVKEEIAEIVRMYNMNDHEIILFSGRDSICKDKTELWLRKNGIPFNQLHMRKENDNRKDSIIKEELYNDYVRNKFFVSVVIDDRKQVVDMWRRIGLTCLQVDKGDF